MILFFYYLLFFYQAMQCLALLSFIINKCIECRPMTPKVDDFRALAVKHSCELINSSKKGYEIKLSFQDIKNRHN